VTVIADTGPLYALIDRSDKWHVRVVKWWKANAERVVIPVCVLSEVCYLLHTRISPDAEASFVKSIADGEFEIEPLEVNDFERIEAIMSKYADLELGFVDAAVAATAERLDAVTVLTTDRKHFSVLRPRHASAFQLSP
jgi:predicted nucleic acid-binding protein